MQFEKSADTKIIEHVLSEAKIGDTITYQQLSKAIGRDVRKYALSALGSARQGLLRDKQFVFSVESNVGLFRLDDNGIVLASESDRLRVHRGAKRALKKLACADFANLTEASKKAHVVASAQMGAIAMFSHKTAANKIESKVNGSAQQLAIGETLKMFV